MRSMYVRLCFCLITSVAALVTLAQSTVNLAYYLPAGVSYNPKVPEPASVIGHQPGAWHVTHDKLVLYMKTLATAVPERIKLQVTGSSYEGREQLLLIITAPKNHAQLETIRKQHLQLCNPLQSQNLPLDAMPAVVCMGYSIHGNESSGANAALIAAYHLAAAQGREMENLLENTVVLLDPSFNPDGLQRFSTWANQHKSKNLVTDPNSREFSEVWPGGRFNHYWFDLNRDWLPAVHVESRNRLQYFHDWRPNILTDHHEMGSGATFFFQPGVPSRVNPLTPAKNQELTSKIGDFHARYLDKIGSLYFTKEGYDDFYYGKGSTFPDIHGSIGILFEQASSRGHAQETPNGLLTFPFTIKNQFNTTLSTLEAAVTLRRELLEYQRDAYKKATEDAGKATTKGYVFGGAYHAYETSLLTGLLQRHRIDVSRLEKDFKDGNQHFKAGEAWYVPCNQPQYNLIRTIFEKTLEYRDSLFYDVTSWTLPLALGLPYAPVTAANASGIRVSAALDERQLSGQFGGSASDYAWVLDWRHFEAPKALYQLLKQNIQVRVATRPFTARVQGKDVSFPQGSVIIPSQMQPLEKNVIASQLMQLASAHAINIAGLSSGLSTSGIDLGSGRAVSVEMPKIAMLVGSGVSATDAGEVWHLLDQRLDIPASHLEINTFNRADLNRYNTLIMVSGSYTGLNKDKLKAWVESGGVLIACEDAVEWCARNGISKLQFKSRAAVADSASMLPYADKPEIDGAQRMAGAIFRADLDLTHPLCFGMVSPYIDLFKTNEVFMLPARNPFASPVRYGKAPLQSGFITQQNYNALKGTASVVVQTVGNGRVIHMADNPNFRAFWLGSMRLFINALFFGRLIDAGSARSED